MFDDNNISAGSYVHQNYINTIQTPNTFENRNVITHNLRIFSRIFSAKIGSKNKNIQPRPGKQYSYLKRRVYDALICARCKGLLSIGEEFYKSLYG